jgi:hypothetical protein
MKGTVVICMRELVVANFGAPAWQRVLETAGVDPATLFMPLSDVDDAVVFRLVESVCKVGGLTMQQALEAYGDFWVNTYTRRIYTRFFACSSAREFILKLADVHTTMTKEMPEARPPRFTYDWSDETRLRVHYASTRGLVDLVVGGLKGIGRYFGEALEVTKLSPTTVEVRFP